MSVLLLFLALASSPPPLSADAIAVLASARDGTDIGDEAFRILVEHAARWPHDIDPSAHPPPSDVLDRIDELRGRAFTITGRLERRRPVEGDRRDLEEWAIRDGSGAVPLVYVLVDVAQEDVVAGDEVVVTARLCQRLELRDTGGRPRSFAAFVGAWPQSLEAAALAPALPPVAMLTACLVALLGAGFLVAAARARRARKGRRPVRRRLGASSGPFDEAFDLPDDPAAALAELRRRSGHAPLQSR